MAKKIPVSGGSSLANHAFGSLDAAGLPEAPASAPPMPPAAALPRRGGRVHLRLEKSGRSGKTVTVVFGEGLASLDDAARAGLLKDLKAVLGCGGAVAAAGVELQGDVRDRVAGPLREAGFRVG